MLLVNIQGSFHCKQGILLVNIQGSLHCKQGMLLVNIQDSLHCKQGMLLVNIQGSLHCSLWETPFYIFLWCMKQNLQLPVGFQCAIPMTKPEGDYQSCSPSMLPSPSTICCLSNL